MKTFSALVIFLLLPAFSFAGIKHQVSDAVSVELSFLGQGWFQYATDIRLGSNTRDLNDFLVRRAYFVIRSQIGSKGNLFVIYGGDRLGQEGLNDSANGLGSGLAIREAWFAYNFHPSFQIQAGRMYVPFTRNFGTTLPLSLMTLDMNFMQGGVRGNIFYPSKVARDDGIVAWGNPADGIFQYRLMVSDGIEDESRSNDSPRVAGGLAFNLGKDREKTWANRGTYLGEKRVIAVAAGFDQQQDLIAGDYYAWTVDFFFDQPLAQGAITLESGYIKIDNAPIALSFTELAPGDDAQIAYLTAGYFIKQIQPYVRLEHLSIEDRGDTFYPAVGVNYYLKGHEQKLTIDFTRVNSENVPDHTFLTVQYTLAF
jgi:hypothetical protein